MFFPKRLMTKKKGGITIVSGCDRLRFKSFINHKIFADVNSASYVWSFMLRKEEANPYFGKLDAVSSTIGASEWIFWLDDDAYFTDFSWNMSEYLKQYDAYDLIICKSPINAGAWTFISSGQFFLRSTKQSMDFIEAVKKVDLEKVKAWWNPEKYGMYTNGDQDALVYILATDKRFSEGNFFIRLDYSEFNSREFHYENNPSEHRLLHLASATKTKQELLMGFMEKFNLNEFLVPENLLKKIDITNYKNMIL